MGMILQVSVGVSRNTRNTRSPVRTGSCKHGSWGIPLGMARSLERSIGQGGPGMGGKFCLCEDVHQKLNGTLSHGPRSVSCDRAIKYSG